MLRLALRLTARSARDNPYAAGVLVLGAGLLTFLALVSVAVPQVVERQAERTYADTPVIAYDAAPTTPATLRTVDPLATPAERWNGHEIERRYYAGSNAVLQVPGVASVPRPGEFYASPELDALMGRDPVIRSLFASLTRVGQIEDSGLSQPHELTAVIGVADDPRLLLRPVSGFGSAQPLGAWDDFAVLNQTVAGIAASLVWLPGLAFLVIVTRLTARRNRLRVRSMRALGLSAAAVRTVQAGETGLLVLPGLALGTVAYDVAVSRATRVPGTDFGFFAEDALLAPPHQALVVGAVAAAAVLLAAFAQPVSWTAARPRAPRHLAPVSSWSVGVVLLCAGFTYLAALPLTAPWFGRFAILGMWISCAMVAAGLAMAGPRLVQSSAGWLAARARTAGTLVGLRVVASSTTTTTRLASLACVVIVLLLGSLSFASILSGGTYDDWDAELDRRDHVPVVATDITGSATAGAVRRVYGGALAQLATIRVDSRNIPVVFATCDDLADLTGAPVSSCNGHVPQWLNRSRPGVSTADLVEPRADQSSGLTVTRSDRLPREFAGALLLPSAKPADLRVTGGSQFYFLPSGQRLVEAMAAVSSTAPGVQFGLGDLDRTNPDFHQYPKQLEWIFVAGAVSLILAALATLAAALGETADRDARLGPLRLLGAGWVEFVRVHMASTLVPILVLGWTAGGVGWFVCRGMRAVDDRADLPLSAVVTALWVTAVVAVGLAAATLPEASRRRD